MLTMPFMPGKHYLVSVDKDKELCAVCPFEVYTVNQSYGNPAYTCSGLVFGSPVTEIDGQLYGTMRILKAVEMENVTYEDIMNLLKE